MKFAAVLLAVHAFGVALGTPVSRTECSAATKILTVPSSTYGTPLAIPVGDPKFVAVSAGVQNYTCSAASTYTSVVAREHIPNATDLHCSSVGAVAELFDLSCISQGDLDAVTALVWHAWNDAPEEQTISAVVDSAGVLDPLVALGQHYFVADPSGSGIAPKWSWYSAGPNAFVVGAQTGEIPAPTDPQVNVDWVSLQNVEGDLADQVFEVQTWGGQPPASVGCSCSPA